MIDCLSQSYSDAGFPSLVNSRAKMLSWPSGSLKEVARMYLIIFSVDCILLLLLQNACASTGLCLCYLC